MVITKVPWSGLQVSYLENYYETVISDFFKTKKSATLFSRNKSKTVLLHQDKTSIDFSQVHPLTIYPLIQGHGQFACGKTKTRVGMQVSIKQLPVLVVVPAAKEEDRLH